MTGAETMTSLQSIPSMHAATLAKDQNHLNRLLFAPITSEYSSPNNTAQRVFM
jgi:hypothetical protein